MLSLMPSAASLKLMPGDMLTSSMSTPYWFVSEVTPRPLPFVPIFALAV